MIYTIGHSTRTINKFTDLLYQYGVELIADIRAYPGSRRYPHFNQEEMHQWLKKEGFEYWHVPLLGGRREEYKISDLSTVSGLRHKAFRNYATYMQTNQFAKGLAALEIISRKYRTAFMCSEALWWKCHRRMVSDALSLICDIDVRHIMHSGLQKHVLTEYAQKRNGCVIYPK